MPSESEMIKRVIERTHLDAVNPSGPAAKEKPFALNPTQGKGPPDPENVDYRYDPIAGTGEGSVSKPEGPSQI